ncbi:MAG: HD domain-containing protein [Rhizobiales bacterium]|nr:HD domain-containing protein [Hyphomicrobiales bacterium]
MLSHRFDEALAYAHALHRAQTRKGKGTPYIAHLMGVAALTLEYGGSEDQAIAALLHDAAEDQGGEATLAAIRARFGEAAAQIVADCTDTMAEPKPAWRPRKEAYLAHLRGADARSLLVSLADKVYNAEAIAEDFRGAGESAFARFAGGPEGTRWYYRALAETFGAVAPGPLAARLRRAVDSFAPPMRAEG